MTFFWYFTAKSTVMSLDRSRIKHSRLYSAKRCFAGLASNRKRLAAIDLLNCSIHGMIWVEIADILKLPQPHNILVCILEKHGTMLVRMQMHCSLKCYDHNPSHKETVKALMVLTDKRVLLRLPSYNFIAYFQLRQKREISCILATQC